MSAGTNNPLSVNQPGLRPSQILYSYEANEWEGFIEEWAEGFDPPYIQVVPLGGAGDMGRDIIGHIDDARPYSCDVFQCKHYAHPIRPSEAYLELGKLCHYTFQRQYPVPRKYSFVPPRGVGPKLYNLLNYPDRLRSQLIANWDKYCLRKISSKELIPLKGDFRTYVDRFDFSIVGFYTANQIVDQHRRTRHHYLRFKYEPPARPAPDEAPEHLQSHELKYVDCLLAAYSNKLHRPISAIDLSGLPEFAKHFRQSRGYFFSAESLARFSRDNFAAGAFELIKQHVYDGVIDVTLMTHCDGYACLLKVMEQSVVISLPTSDLMQFVYPADRKGMCHHLANDGKLSWVKEL